MFKLDKNTTAVLLAAIAAGGAWADQHNAVSRIEAKVDALARDVAVLQHESKFARSDDE